ncbi:MAG: histidine phosphatase family protein [Thermodesulfobacteriota bacterium]
MSKLQKPTRLYLVRHGEVVPRGQGKFLGFTDLGLSAEGKRQVSSLADYLRDKPIDLAYASDLNRTLTTAGMICRDRGIPVNPVPEFREMDMGLWDGKSWVEIKKEDPEADPRFNNLSRFHFPEGEHWYGFRKRVLKSLKDLLERGRGKHILLVAHAGVNRVILAQALGLPFKHMFRLDQANACLNVIEYYKTGAKVVLMNGVFYR